MNENIKFTLSEENCHIFNSYLITSKAEMIEFCSTELPFRFTRARSIISYVREWRAHNLLYALHICVKSTKDTDLNMNESKIRRFFYFFLSLIYPHR